MQKGRCEKTQSSFFTSPFFEEGGSLRLSGKASIVKQVKIYFKEVVVDVKKYRENESEKLIAKSE